MKKIFLVVMMLIAINMVVATQVDPDEPIQCDADITPDSDDVFNKVDYIDGKIQNKTHCVSTLRKYTAIDNMKVGIYTVAYNDDGQEQHVKYIYYKGDAQNCYDEQEIDLNDQIVFFDVLNGQSVALVDEGQDQRFVRILQYGYDSSLDYASYDLQSDFYNGTSATNVTPKLNASSYILKGLIDVDQDSQDIYTLWQATKQLYIIFKTCFDGPTTIYRKITTSVGAQLECASKYLCFDNTNDRFYKLTDGEFAQAPSNFVSFTTNINNVTVNQLQQFNVQFSHITASNCHSRIPVLWATDQSQQKVFRAFFTSGTTPVLIDTYQYLDYGCRLKNIIRGYNGQIAELTKTRLFFSLGVNLGSQSTGIVQYDSSNHELSSYICNDVLYVSFATQNVIILTKDSMIQFGFQNDDDSYIQTDITRLSSSSQIWLSKEIKLTSKANELLTKPLNQMWIIIRNICICVNHAVKDMTCFDNFQCIVSIDYQESDCSDYNQNNAP